MTQKNETEDDLTGIGQTASFEMKPFLAVMFIAVAMCILLWTSFQGERHAQEIAAAPVIEQAAPIATPRSNDLRPRNAERRRVLRGQ